MLTLLAMMCCLHVVVGRDLVVSSRLKMMLNSFGLCIGNHSGHLGSLSSPIMRERCRMAVGLVVAMIAG